MDILKKIAEQREKEKQLAWEGTFSEYLEIVRKRPQVAQTAHSRVYNMIISHGVEVDEQGNKRYPFFSRELFGLDRAIERLVEEYFHSAARRLDVRKRILLLMGRSAEGNRPLSPFSRRGWNNIPGRTRGRCTPSRAARCTRNPSI